MPTRRDPMQATQKAKGIGPTAFDPVQAAIDKMGGLMTGTAPLPTDLSSLRLAELMKKFGGQQGVNEGVSAAQNAALNATQKETGALPSEIEQLKKLLFGE